MHPPADPDRPLLDRYIARRDELAFRTLVDRHLPLVHGVARRITSSDDLAKDVAQATFIRLAERAALIPRDTPLPSWLHRVSHHFAIDLVRSEARRKKREIDSHPDSSAMEPSWSALAPVIDDLVNRLPARDRDVLLLRYYRNESHARIGARLGLSEDLARKRSARALEKLRVLLGKRGVATSSAALAMILPAHAAAGASVPAGLSAVIAQAAGGVVPLIPHGLSGLLLAMNTTQKIALAGTAALLLAAAAVYSSSSHGAPVSAAPATAPTGQPAPSQELSSRPRPERAAARTPEEEMERLLGILALPGDPQRTRELISFLDSLPRARFAAIANYLSKDLAKHRKEYGLALSAWAREDIQAALAYGIANGSSSSTPLTFVIPSWAASDPDAALAWIRDNSNNNAYYLGLAIGSVARTDPAAAMNIVNAIQDPQKRTSALQAVLADMSDQPDPVGRMLAVTPDADQRTTIVSAGAAALARTDPAAALALLQDHPEVPRDAYPPQIFGEWAKSDFAAASGALASLQPGPDRSRAVDSVVVQIATDHPADAAALLDRYPDALDDQVVSSLVQAFMPGNPAAALDQVPRISNEGTRDAVYVGQLTSWLASDEPAARAWLDSHDLPPAVREKLPVH
jgi:RNA polymerase sigma factor (sigma-70 family)